MTRLSVRQLVVLSLAALLAAGVAGSVAASGDDTYEGRALVFVSSVLPPNEDPARIDNYISDLETAMDLPVVEDVATQAVEVEPGEYVIGTNRSLGSDTVEVIATGDDPETATELARQTARAAVALLAQQELDQAQAAEDAAVAAEQAAREDLLDLTLANETDDPVDRVDELEATVVVLTGQLDAAGLSPAAQADLENRISAIQEQIDELAPLRAEFISLQRTLDQATALADQATGRRINAEAGMQTAISDNVIVPLDAETESKLATVAQAAVAAAVVVALAGWGLFHLLNARAERRRERQAEAAEPLVEVLDNDDPDGVDDPDDEADDQDGAIDPAESGVSNLTTNSSDDDEAEGFRAAAAGGGGDGMPPAATSDTAANQQTVVKDDFSKTPRNAPCPCGSGKKFKNCHGKS